MGEVARLPRTWQAPEASMSTAHTFESFFEDEKDRLLRVLSVITGSTAEAEDIAQEAFTRVLERWDSVRSMENPSAYLYKTAMNGFRSEYRRAALSLKRVVGIGPRRRRLPGRRGSRARSPIARPAHASTKGRPRPHRSARVFRGRSRHVARDQGIDGLGTYPPGPHGAERTLGGGRRP